MVVYFLRLEVTLMSVHGRQARKSRDKATRFFFSCMLYLLGTQSSRIQSCPRWYTSSNWR